MACNLLTDTMLRVLVDQNSASWNQIAGSLRQLDLIRAAA